MSIKIKYPELQHNYSNLRDFIYDIILASDDKEVLKLNNSFANIYNLGEGFIWDKNDESHMSNLTSILSSEDIDSLDRYVYLVTDDDEMPYSNNSLKQLMSDNNIDYELADGLAKCRTEEFEDTLEYYVMRSIGKMVEDNKELINDNFTVEDFLDIYYTYSKNSFILDFDKPKETIESFENLIKGEKGLDENIIQK